MRVVIIAVALALLAACGETPPLEEAILNNVSEIQGAIEGKDRSGVLDHLSDNFSANQHIDKEGVGKMLLAQFLVHKKISVTILRSEVTPHPGYNFLAEGKHSIVVTGADRLVPDSARVYEVTSSWELMDGDWMLTGLAWK